MRQSIKRLFHFTKSALFSIAFHGALAAILLFGSVWSLSQRNDSGLKEISAIRAQTVSLEAIRKKQREEQERREQAERLRALKQKQEEDRKRKKLAAEKKKQQEIKQRQERQKQQAKRKQEALKKKREQEKKRQEAENKKRQVQKQQQLRQAEKQRLEKEKKRQEQERRKHAEETERQENEVRRRLEEERQEKIRKAAIDAFGALSARIRAAIQRDWIRPAGSAAGLKAIIRVQLSQTGDVVSVNVVKSSGDRYFDRSAELAVRKASPLPFPDNPQYYEHLKVIEFEFNPDNL